MHIYIVCPVRSITTDAARKLQVYVDELERQGHSVYFPLRDTDMSDRPGALSIAQEEVTAMHMAVEAHIWYAPDCEDIVFALGALMMSSLTNGPRKRIVLINRGQVLPTTGPSTANLLLAMARNRDA